MTQLIVDITPEQKARLEKVAQKEGRPPAAVVSRFLNECLDREQPEEPADRATLPPRVFDLHPGAAEMSDDFDAPLPDSFWLGEE